jgi:two-component system OmpR family sensor kinase
MKALSLRASLLLWMLLLTSFLLLAFSLALYSGVRQSLLAGIDAALRARLDATAAVCEWEDGVVKVELPDAPTPASVGDDREVWRWPEQQLVHRDGAAIDVPLAIGVPDDDSASPRFRTTTVTVAGREVRLGVLVASFAPTAELPAFAVLVRAVEPLAPLEAQLAAIRWFTFLLTAVAMVAVLGFGAFVSRRFAMPLQRLGEAAASARAGEPTAMPRRGSGDEIDRLAAILDESFRSLHAAVALQKRFTADASHELRNPIAELHSTAEIALRRERSASEYAAALRAVLAVSERMGRMLEALLLLTRLDARAPGTDFADVDLAAVVREAAALAGTGVEVAVDGETPVAVRGNADLLAIAAGNLLANARQHAPGVGPVRIELRRAEGSVELRVRDRGPGIPAAEQQRVFDRFRRGTAANGSGNGAGLGLAIVAAIAAAHGGRCRVEPTDQGTCMLLQLPSSATKAK